MVLRLAKTKTFSNLSVEVVDPFVAELVRKWIAGRRSGDSLFGVSEDKFREVFRVSCWWLGLSSDVAPHSLRHGGATHALTQMRMSEEAVKRRGRWQKDEYFRIYIQQAKAMSIAMSVPVAVSDFGSRVAVDLPHSFDLAWKSWEAEKHCQ